MNKKLVIALMVTVIALLYGIIANHFRGKDDFYNDNLKINKETNIDSDSIEEIYKEPLNIESVITIEDEYFTSIKQGIDDSETIIVNGVFRAESFTVEDRIIAKNIAENFAQGIALYERDNPDKNLNKARKYADSGLDVRQMIEQFAYAGAKENIKQMKGIGIESSIFDYNANDYMVSFKVTVNWEWIDNYDLVASRASTDYVIILNKIKGLFKVTDYYIP